MTQFSPSPIRKASTGSRGSNPTVGTSVRQFAAVHSAAEPLNQVISTAYKASPLIANSALGTATLRNKISDAPKTIARSRSNGSSASFQHGQKTAANKENEMEVAPGEIAPAANMAALTNKNDLGNTNNNNVTEIVKEATCQKPANAVGASVTNTDTKLRNAHNNANLQAADIFAPRQAGKETTTTQVMKALAASTATSMMASLQIDEMGLYKPRSNLAPTASKFDFCQPALRSSKEIGQAAGSGASNTSSMTHSEMIEKLCP